MRQQRARAISLLLFLAACFGVFVYLFSLSGGGLVPLGHGYQVQAVVPDAVALSTHADVREAGVRVGEVTELRAYGANTALLLALDDAHAPIYRDARVLVRTKSVAGENYLELDPGRPSAGEVPNGGLLPIDHAEEATQIDQVLSVLNGEGRRNLQRMLDGLGSGLDRRGADLNRLLESAAALTKYGDPVTQTLADERVRVAGLVDAFGRVTRALGDRRDAIRLLARRSRVTVEAVAARDEQLRRALAELPAFLRQTRATATRLSGFSIDAMPVMRDLRLAVQDLVPAMQELRPAAAAGQRTVHALDRFAVVGTPALTQLRPFANAAARLVPPLAGTLRQANPLLGYLARYWRELSSFLAQAGAAAKYTDQTGHIGRILPLLSRSSLPGTMSPADEKLLRSLTGEGADTRGVNAYPAPAEAGLAKPFTGNYPRLEADPPYTVRRR